MSMMMMAKVDWILYWMELLCNWHKTRKRTSNIETSTLYFKGIVIVCTLFNSLVPKIYGQGQVETIKKNYIHLPSTSQPNIIDFQEDLVWHQTKLNFQYFLFAYILKGSKLFGSYSTCCTCGSCTHGAKGYIRIFHLFLFCPEIRELFFCK